MIDGALEPGSFRDRSARVFYHDGAVLRGLSAYALQQWQALAATAFFQRHTAEGAIVRSDRIDPSTLTARPLDSGWAAILRHETIPFASYPYEWTFGMLKDAALLQLDLLIAALDEGMTLKDASSFNNRRILPLVVDVSDPSPDLGWRNRERRHLAARGRPDLVICLALVHHLVIGANIPMSDLLEWLSDLGADLIIEFVTRDDPKVQALLRNKEDQYTDYDLAVFERELAGRFVVNEREPLASGTRILYHARRGAVA